MVPQRAVLELQGSYRVAVVGPDNKAAIRPVKTGERVENMWVITSGLNPGERVVVEGIQKVRDGMPVTPKAVDAEFKQQPGSSPKPETKAAEPAAPRKD